MALLDFPFLFGIFFFILFDEFRRGNYGSKYSELRYFLPSFTETSFKALAVTQAKAKEYLVVYICICLMRSGILSYVSCPFADCIL